MAVATRTNEDIKKDVVDQLYWDSRVDASNVRVTVADGVVTLSGTVPAYLAYTAAENDAWSISGVRCVRNDLTLKYPAGAAMPSDARIIANIHNLLFQQPDIDSTDIDITVEDGRVVFRGSVDALSKKVRVEELTMGVSGVLGIINELVVVPTNQIADKAVAEAIEAALERRYNVDEDTINVTVENGRVTLAGTVDSRDAFLAAQRTAENTLGVLAVDNELSIR